MNPPFAASAPWQRRAQPLLGTLVEVGVRDSGDGSGAAFEAAFDAVREVQACLSRFDPDSDLARFHALRPGESMPMRAATRQVLAAAQALQAASDGAGLHKTRDGVRLDLGGIGKGHAVDCAVAALIARGVAAGWVNAGGDLRTFGDAELPIHLRDEASGGVRAFASLRNGAFATSHFDRCSRSKLTRRPSRPGLHAHVSVAAPLCLWADALTKVIAIGGDTLHPLLARFGAQAWLH